MKQWGRKLRDLSSLPTRKKDIVKNQQGRVNAVNAGSTNPQGKLAADQSPWQARRPKVECSHSLILLARNYSEWLEFPSKF